jgi:biopolymer transport protein ExbB/TolQ
MEYVIISLIIIVSVMALVLIIQAVKLTKVNKQYKQLMRGMTNENVEEILLKYIDRVDEYGDRLLKSEKEIASIHQLIAQKAANVSITRYNAYEEQGNDLSFSIAILNDERNGFVITSLYNRHDQRVYAKPIIAGKSTYALSIEEKQVIDEAIK